MTVTGVWPGCVRLDECDLLIVATARGVADRNWSRRYQDHEARGPTDRTPAPPHVCVRRCRRSTMRRLIATKVRAIAEAPERTWQDVADVGFLVRLDGMNRDEVRGYFERAGLGAKWHALERTL